MLWSRASTSSEPSHCVGRSTRTVAVDWYRLGSAREKLRAPARTRLNTARASHLRRSSDARAVSIPALRVAAMLVELQAWRVRGGILGTTLPRRSEQLQLEPAPADVSRGAKVRLLPVERIGRSEKI